MRRHEDGGPEGWLDGWPDRLARFEPLKDSTWLAARDEAVQRVVPPARLGIAAQR